MRHSVYAAFLRLPSFRGKGRLTPLIRDRLFRQKPRKIAHGLSIFLDPIEWVQSDMLRDGLSEPLTTQLFGQLLQPGDTYIDVGAHIGYHTLIARHYVGDQGRIFAVEPQPYNCNRILENWTCNNFENICVYAGAAGSTKASVTLGHQENLDRSQLSIGRDLRSSGVRFRVPLIPLSILFTENHLTKVKLVKIDVEGFERSVLQGFRQEMHRVEHIILEVLDPYGAGPVLEELSYNGFNQLRTVEGTAWEAGTQLIEGNLWASRQKTEAA